MSATTDVTAAEGAGATALIPPISPGSGTPPSAPVAVARWAAIGVLASLIALCVAWETWLAPTGRGTLASKALPLLAALPGLWRHRLYTYRWLSLLVWLYVLEGLVRATSEQGLGAVLAGAEVVLAAGLFAIVTFYIRRRLAAGPGERPSA
jgi:uncharacterized membrane protein